MARTIWKGALNGDDGDLPYLPCCLIMVFFCAAVFREMTMLLIAHFLAVPQYIPSVALKSRRSRLATSLCSIYPYIYPAISSVFFV